MKWIIPVALLMIIASLGSALYYMMKDRGNGSPRMVRSLMLRIGLSILLFLGILLAYRLGYIQPTGIQVGVN